MHHPAHALPTLAALLLLPVLTLPLIGGCVTPEGGDPGAADRSAPPSNDDEVTGDVDAAVIAGVVDGIHLAEIEQAEYMLRDDIREGISTDILAFAERMVEHHTKGREELSSLMAELDVSPEPSLLQARLSGEAAAVMTNMRAVRAVRLFDLEASYVNGQIMMHERALEVLRDTLLPSAKSKNMRAYLEKSRGQVAEHLDAARDLKARLDGRGDEEPVSIR